MSCGMIMQNNEKRQDVRVDISARAKVKMIDPKEMERNHHPYSTPFNLADFITRMEENQDPIIGYLVDSLGRMEEKLDQILNALEGTRQGEERTVKQTIDISGSGIRFVLPGPVEKGQLLDISLQIPGFPLGRLYAFGEVVHSRPHPGPEEGYYEVGVKFIKMTPEQREAIIAFAFQQQRGMIRRNKEKKIPT